MADGSTIERAIVIVLDGVGVGQASDAAAYGDEGANCLANCARAVGGLALPTLGHLGLGNLTEIAGTPPQPPMGACGRLIERSPGKDSTTGHWELMGVVLDRPLPTYPHGFPADLVARFEEAIGHRVLGNKPASGTAIIEELGAEHLRTGFPILYTSADSVFQLAAHEDVIPLSDLYRMCAVARGLLTGENAVGRVIARPFTGAPGAFVRTPHRRDFSLEPPAPTLLDALKASGREVVGIGKIEDLFALRGLTASNHTATNAEGEAAALVEVARPFAGLLFVNLVEFDQNFGHRRNPAGYAEALRAFDAWLPSLLARLGDGDVLFITGDHGTDPTWRGTDHTRESVPLLVAGKPVRPGVHLGARSSFADLGATLAEAFGLPPLAHGESFARELGLMGDSASV
ncbi:MAG TPA: phosphopentomutase [Ktedonobacterales bacterium]|nr:phosphopentomutase [Ktedonobacterales bacterium]